MMHFRPLVPLLIYAADWPVPKSIKCDSTGTFQCLHTGKFEDPFDPTCTKYLLCSEFDNERIKVELTCPDNTFYDPIIERCSSNYKCICDIDNSSITPVTTSATLTTTYPYPDECSICSQCITKTSTIATTSKDSIWTTHSPEKTTLFPKSSQSTNVTKNTSMETSATSETFTDITHSNPFTSRTNLPSTQLSSESITSEPMSTSTETYPATKTTSFETTQLSSEFTTATSHYCSIGGNFTCNKTGRFVNPNDSTCNSYFYCFVWSDGRLDQYLYSCSVGLFNPDKGACDRSYICPCSETTTSEMKTSPTTSNVPSSEPMSTSTETSPPTKTTSFKTTQLSSESTTATPHYCSIGRNFTCNKTGRFINPNDYTCNSYFYCFVWSDGRLDQYLYSCSVGLFNPDKGACDRSYICPCLETTTSEMKTSPTTSNVSSSEPMSTSTETSPATKTTSFETTQLSLESTTATSHYCSIGGTFTCNETGRFVNPNDSTCNSYFYCFVWSDGRLDQYLYTCSVGLFNPDKGACDRSYICPCSETTTSEIKTYPTTSNVSSSEPTSTSTETSPATKTTRFETTQLSSEFTTATSHYCSIGGTFTCNETGRFVNPNDSTCNSYFYCFVWSDGRLDQYLYSCSVGLFNPDKGACDRSYICPCSETTTSEMKTSPTTSNVSSSEPMSTSTETSPATKTTSFETTQLSLESTTATSHYCSIGGTFTCNETGRFVNPNDSTCNSYFYCFVWSDGRLDQYLYTCSVGLFNPDKGACDRSYICPCSETTTSEIKTYPTTSNVSSSEPTSTSTETSPATKTTRFETTQLSSESTTATSHYCSIGGTFTCNETGRFVNPNDSTCNSYFYCFVWSDGRLDQYLYTCSVGLFNPDKGACDRSYICPCSETTTSVMKTSPTTSNVSSSEPMSTSTETSPATKTKRFETTQLSSESTTATSHYCSIGGTFTCNETGRFVNPNDSTCNSYFYCFVWLDGRLDQYLYSCSVGLFNPDKGACDRSYICPCSETTTSEIKTYPTTSNVSSSEPTSTSTETSPATKTTRFETTQLSSESTTATSHYCSIGGTFTCNETGRFVNPNDSTCNSYFYCFVWSDGRLDQYLYSCSVGLFNPDKGACDRSYICPCLETTTSEIKTYPTTSNVSSSEPTSTETSPATKTTSFETTQLSSEFTTATSHYCSIGGNFTCNETGRFVNPNDSTCNSYFYCFVWSDGRLDQYLYSCSVGLFNPDKGACDRSYICPCSETSTSVMKTSPTTSNVSSSEPTSTSTETSPATKTTRFETTQLSSESTTATSHYCSVGGNFTCNETGRFVNPNDSTCNSYFYCFVWSDGRLDQYLYSCSVGLFNPDKGACDRSYICPCSETTTTETKTSHTTSNVSSSGPMYASNETTVSLIPISRKTSSTSTTFTCSYTGRFANQNDSTCKTYHYCLVYPNGRVRQSLNTCVLGKFNPKRSRCEIFYRCS